MLVLIHYVLLFLFKNGSFSAYVGKVPDKEDTCPELSAFDTD